jgi:hypothetical protein
VANHEGVRKVLRYLAVLAQEQPSPSIDFETLLGAGCVIIAIVFVLWLLNRN